MWDSFPLEKKKRGAICCVLVISLFSSSYFSCCAFLCVLFLCCTVLLPPPASLGPRGVLSCHGLPCRATRPAFQSGAVYLTGHTLGVVLLSYRADLLFMLFFPPFVRVPLFVLLPQCCSPAHFFFPLSACCTNYCCERVNPLVLSTPPPPPSPWQQPQINLKLGGAESSGQKLLYCCSFGTKAARCVCAGAR